MAHDGKIIIVDLHNTLYDEVLEYGQAIKAAASFVVSEAEKQGSNIALKDLYAGLASAHASLKSDWDDDAWTIALRPFHLARSTEMAARAVEIRRSCSEALTRRYAYAESIRALRELRASGAEIIVATEATANAAADAIRWLDLDGVVTAIYSWPFGKSYKALEKTQILAFPQSLAVPGTFLQKPHPLILGSIVVDIAKRRNLIPPHVSPGEVFELEPDLTIDITPIIARIDTSVDHAQALETVRSVRARLRIKDTNEHGFLADITRDVVYVGDSLFKDGLLARNSGVEFILAQYGKKVSDRKLYDECKSILYDVTGWDRFLLQLTQEAAELPILADLIKPKLICGGSLMEYVESI